MVAESEALAEDGVELVEVELEPLEPVLDLEAATQPGRSAGPRQRPRRRGRARISATPTRRSPPAAIGDEEELSDNVLDTARLANGDVDAALAASHVGRAGHGSPRRGCTRATSSPRPRRPGSSRTASSSFRSSTQAPFATRDSLAKLFGLPVEQIRVRSAPLGGAFGGKIMIIDPLVASAALVLRRPVRLAMTRSEDMAASNPAGAEMLIVELGADAEGNLTGIRSRVLVDRGSTDDFGVESIAAMLSAGPYRWQAHELTALGVATNRMTFGAYRAPDRRRRRRSRSSR